MHTATRPAPDDLARVPLLAALTGEQRAALARHLDVVHFRDREVIVSEGAYGGAFYLVVAGRLEARHGASVVGTLATGDFFGELALLLDGHRHATVVGVEPGTLWRLFGTTFRALEREHPEIAAVIDGEAVRRGSAPARG